LAEILKDERFRCSVSATTRAPRPGEVDGVNYHFLTREDFESRVAAGEFLENAEYCGNCYGTLASEVDVYLEKGQNVILEISARDFVAAGARPALAPNKKPSRKGRWGSWVWLACG
ncbi:MAG: hypothetical protein J6B48_06035, partial [Clostridia bacterium]|nr:hypothetical protein [Clostridia bacterium]